MTTKIRLSLIAAVVLLLAAAPASAGSVAMAWDPVSDPDLAGYRVYYGTSTRNYTQSVDVGNVTQYTVNGLSDCTNWFLAVKAYNTSSMESTSYSNEVSGWPRPSVATVAPGAAEQGRTLNLTITGSNFQGGATVEFANSGITVSSVVVNSCSQITATVVIAANAAPGATNVDVLNPGRVYGTLLGGFAVQAAAPPTVSSTSPADGATGVAVGVSPTVTFSEAMLAASITSSTVQLLIDAGSPLAQAGGSPSLSSNGLTATITPAQSLSQGKTYKIRVVGGASGAKDLAGNAMASTYTQATGFSTVADTTAPTIGNVQATSVGSTTATITWTTDESADSQVFHRRQGETAYQQTAVDTSLVTSHSVALQGLSPSSTYEYYVRSADGAGNAAQSSPNTTFSTAANSYAYLRIEAELGDLTSPVRTRNDATVFGGKYLDTPSGTAPGTPGAPAGTAVLGFNVPASGSWRVWLRMYGAATTSDDWFESVNGAARQSVRPSQTGTWMWVQARSYTLSAGLASLELGGLEAQARIDRVLITNDPAFVPTEQSVGDQTPPAALASFTAVAGDAQNNLSWTNPPDADFAKTVVRFRTDGTYPTSPVDGFAATEAPGVPSASGSHVHGALTNGTAYGYSAFAVDGSGNVSARRTASATPQPAVQPPDPVTNVRRTDVK